MQVLLSQLLGSWLALESGILLATMEEILAMMVAMSVPMTFRRVCCQCGKARNRLLEVALVPDLVAVMAVAAMTSALTRRKRRKMRHLHLHLRILRLSLGRAGNLKFPLAKRYGTSMRTGRLSFLGRLRN